MDSASGAAAGFWGVVAMGGWYREQGSGNRDQGLLTAERPSPGHLEFLLEGMESPPGDFAVFEQMDSELVIC
jgi:hypothetical protein